MKRLFASERSEAGETLIEVIMSAGLMGLVAVAIIGGLATTLLGSAIHRKQADANTVLVAAMEQLKSPDVARVCPPSTYTVPAGVTIERIEYQTIVVGSGTPFEWSMSPSACSLTSPLTLQRIKLRYTTPDSSVDPELSFIKGAY